MNKINTGFVSLEKITGGYTKGDLWMIESEANDMNTIIGVNLVKNIKKCNENCNILYFGNQKRNIEIMLLKEICVSNSINIDDIINYECSSDQIIKYEEIRDNYFKSELEYIMKDKLSITSLVEKCENMVKKNKLDVLIIDDLNSISVQTFEIAGKDYFRNVVKSIKDIGEKLGIVVILLVNISKPCFGDETQLERFERNVDILFTNVKHNDEIYKFTSYKNKYNNNYQFYLRYDEKLYKLEDLNNITVNYETKEIRVTGLNMGFDSLNKMNAGFQKRERWMILHDDIEENTIFAFVMLKNIYDCEDKSHYSILYIGDDNKTFNSIFKDNKVDYIYKNEFDYSKVEKYALIYCEIMSVNLDLFKKTSELINYQKVNNNIELIIFDLRDYSCNFEKNFSLLETKKVFENINYITLQLDTPSLILANKQIVKYSGNWDDKVVHLNNDVIISVSKLEKNIREFIVEFNRYGDCLDFKLEFDEDKKWFEEIKRWYNK